MVHPFSSRLLVVVLLGVAIGLRSVSLGSFHPIDPDELSWLMSGTSLWQTGVPQAWTIYTAVYQAAGATLAPAPAPFLYEAVAPYLDHPPLFSLLVGGWLLLMSGGLPQELVWGVARLPMIIIAGATLWLTYRLALVGIGRSAAVWVLAAFAFFPSHIVSARLITAEHLLGLFLILTLWLLLQLAKPNSAGRRWAAMISLLGVSLLAPWVKLTGLIIAATGLLFAVWQRAWWLAVAVACAAVAALAGWFFYGAAYSSPLFSAVWQAHHLRPQSFAHFWTFFTRLDIGAYQLFDPSIIVGWIGLIVLMMDRRLQTIRVAVFCALIATSFFFLYVAPVEFYGWYKYLLYPLLALGLGYVFWRAADGEYGYFVLIVPLLALMLEQAAFLPMGALRPVLVLLYALVGGCFLLPRRQVALRNVAVAYLLLLFLCESLWSVQVITSLPPQ